MTTFIFFLAIAVVMGLAALVWDRGRLGSPARLDQYECFLDRDPDRFRHLSRIMGHQDRDFLRSIPGAEHLAARLERDRRRVLRLVLSDLQEEFRALVAVGVMLAAAETARQDSFGVKLMWQTVRFHCVCWLLRAASYLPVWSIPFRNTDWVTIQVRLLRETTRNLLAALTESDMSELRNQILS
jgi:hypothetical protein